MLAYSWKPTEYHMPMKTMIKSLMSTPEIKYRLLN